MTEDHQSESKRKAPRGKRKHHTTSEFDKLVLPDSVLEGIHDQKYETMMPIQRQALPITLEGRDLTGQAQTGTGKTAAFLITIFARLMERLDPNRVEPLALVLAPTRELAVQSYRVAQAIGKHTPFRMGVVYGGVGYHGQEKKLAAGMDLVIGTPGRLLDFVHQKKLDLSRIEILVIDEADRMLDMGFADELRAILRRLPPPKKRQSMLFSATLDSKTKAIANGYMNRPHDVAIRPEQITAEGIEEKVFHVDRGEKIPLLLGLLKNRLVTKGLVFTNMKIRAAFIAEKLRRNGYDVELLTGDLPQSKRQHVLDRFSAGDVPLLVASDVASRGLQIEDITHIFNYDVPQDPEDYVHRIGRTARAGKAGVAFTLACDEYVYHLDEIENLLDRRLPFQIPTSDQFGEDADPDFTYEKFRRRERRSRSPHGRPRDSKGRSRTERGRPRGAAGSGPAARPSGRSGNKPGSRDRRSGGRRRAPSKRR